MSLQQYLGNYFIVQEPPKDGTQFIAIWHYMNTIWSGTFRYKNGVLQRYECVEDVFENVPWELETLCLQNLQYFVKVEIPIEIPVGTKVKIKENLFKINTGSKTMYQYAGKITTIRAIHQHEWAPNNPAYFLDIDDGKWEWAKSWFDVLEEKMLNI